MQDYSFFQLHTKTFYVNVQIYIGKNSYNYRSRTGQFNQFLSNTFLNFRIILFK
jgi:hypothetical protein